MTMVRLAIQRRSGLAAGSQNSYSRLATPHIGLPFKGRPLLCTSGYPMVSRAARLKYLPLRKVGQKRLPQYPRLTMLSLHKALLDSESRGTDWLKGNPRPPGPGGL